MLPIIKSYKQYQETYQKSIENPSEFWGEIAEHFLWNQKWDTVLESDWTKPETKWFVGGKLNIPKNCLDRHVATRPN